MADTYRQQGVIGQIPMASASTGNSANQGLAYAQAAQREADARAQMAQETYQLSMASLAQQSMQDLYATHKNNPQKLEEELDKVRYRMSEKIQDEGEKVRFLADFNVKKSSYLSSAKENALRIIQKNYKSNIHDTIIKNNETIGLSFANLLGSQAVPDDYINFMKAATESNSLIDTLNDDGTYMFTDEQRERFGKQQEESIANAMKDVFAAMSPYEKERLYNQLIADDVSIFGKVSKKDDHFEIETANLKDSIPLDIYEAFKAFTQKVMKSSKALLEDGSATTPEKAYEIAMTQQVANQMYKEQWGDDKKGIKNKGLYDVLDYRMALENALSQNELSRKDYASLMGQTVPVVLEKVSKQKAGNPVWWNTSFDEAILAIADKVNLANEPDEVKSYVYDMTYVLFKEAGIEPDKRYFKDGGAIENIARKVSEHYLKNKEPGLLGVEANKVLLGTKVYDYKPVGKDSVSKSGGKNYQLMKDKQGNVFKVYKDKDGKFSNNSIFQRIVK